MIEDSPPALPKGRERFVFDLLESLPILSLNFYLLTLIFNNRPHFAPSRQLCWLPPRPLERGLGGKVLGGESEFYSRYVYPYNPAR